MTRDRGQYASLAARPVVATDGSACADQRLRLVQRFDQVKPDAMQALIASLVQDRGATWVAPSSGNAQRWEVNLANVGAIVRLSWQPALDGALVVTIESAQPHRAGESLVVRHQFEGVLDGKIEPLLLLFGATSAGAVLEGPADVQVGQSAGQSTDRVTTIVVEKKSSTLSKVISVFAVVGAVLWGRHQSRQIERLYQRLEVPYQTFTESLREGAVSVADRVRLKRAKRSF